MKESENPKDVSPINPSLVSNDFQRFIREVARTEAAPMPEWDDTAPDFYLVGSIHCRHAAALSACLGIFCVVGGFIAAIIEFDWYYYETYVDIIVLTGFTFFLIMGVIVHAAVLQGLQKLRPPFLRPYIFFHVCGLIIGLVIALSAVGDLVSDQTQVVERRNQIAINALIVIPPCICVQFAMLISVIKCKNYMIKKCEHLARVEGIRP